MMREWKAFDRGEAEDVTSLDIVVNSRIFSQNL